MSFADVVILLGDAPYQIEPVVSDFPGAFNHQLGARIARWKNDLMNVDVMLNDKDKVTEAIWEVRGSGEINSVVPVSAVVID